MSQYDFYSGGGLGGGGFVQGGGSPYSQTGSPGAGLQKSEASMSLRPITAHQFLKTEQSHGDAPWTLDGHEIGHVTLVGSVVSMQQHTTNHIYTISDGYGIVEARHWVGTTGNTEAEMEKWSGVQEGIYVRVSGFLKSFGNKKYINASYMKPVTDWNEIAFHHAECIVVTLILERGPPHNPGMAQQKMVAGGSGSSAYQPNAAAMDTRDEYSNLPQLQQQIVRYLIAQDNKDGVHVAMIAKSLRADAEQLSEALDALMDGGHLYNTLDDNHFTVSR